MKSWRMGFSWKTEKDIDAYIQETVQKWRIPVLVIARVKGDSMVCMKSFERSGFVPLFRKDGELLFVCAKRSWAH